MDYIYYIAVPVQSAYLETVASMVVVVVLVVMHSG